jgi:hypothetical protein
MKKGVPGGQHPPPSPPGGSFEAFRHQWAELGVMTHFLDPRYELIGVTFPQPAACFVLLCLGLGVNFD